MKRILSLTSILFTVLSAVIPQESQTSSTAITSDAQLALSSPDYQVTAGDIYTLVYSIGTTAVNYRITVDSSYRIRVSNLGSINAAGKTYRQLKTEAERIVTNNYPLSGVQLVLTQPASFKVYITGEVKTLEEPTTWALARLSSLLGGTNTQTNSANNVTTGDYASLGNVSNITDTSTATTTRTTTGALTAYSSLRDITITSSTGKSKTYDLFKAQRYGDLSQDPYLRPGDIIRINRVERVVTVEGSVERPGEYQLLPGENLSELITTYASNVTPVADSSRIELVRYVEAGTESGEKLYLTEQDIRNNYPLHNLDVVTVPSIVDLIPVMFVEGAVQGLTVGNQQLTLATAQTNVSNRLTVRFNQGENYASLVRRNSTWFTAVSDTQNAYLIRGEERIPMNINPMLYDSNYRSQYLVERNDTLIIPFRQYFVTVAGAVLRPDRYPYIPDREWDYYVALAGGFVRERNSFESVVIRDMSGKRMKKIDAITPETVITARTNAGLYYFNQYAPVITTVFSIITTFFTVYSLINRQ